MARGAVGGLQWLYRSALQGWGSQAGRATDPAAGAPDVSCPAAVKDTLLLKEPKPSAHAAHALTHLTTPA